MQTNFFYNLSEFNHYKIPKILVPIYRGLIRFLCVLIFFWSKKRRKQVRAYCINRMHYNFSTENAIILHSVWKRFFQNKEQFSTIILGSSHAQFGYRHCNSTEINLGMTNGDLYYSYHLLNTVLKESRSVRNIVLFFSSFSSDFYIQKSSVALGEITASMHVLWNIPRYSKGHITDKELKIEKSVRSFLNKYKNRVSLNYEEYTNQRQNSPLSLARISELHKTNKFFESELDRTKKHRIFAINSGSLYYLKLIFQKVQEFNLNLYIVLPPYMREYTKAFDSKNSIFLHLSQYIYIRNQTRLRFLILHTTRLL